MSLHHRRWVCKFLLSLNVLIHFYSLYNSRAVGDCAQLSFAGIRVRTWVASKGPYISMLNSKEEREGTDLYAN